MTFSLVRLVFLGTPKRRLTQFSLCSLLTVVALLCIWLGLQVPRAHRQRHSASNIRRLGGQVLYDFQFVAEKHDSDAVSPLPAWLKVLMGNDFFHNVVEVRLIRNLDGPNDKALSYLPGVPRLKRLVVGTQATDDGLAYVGRLNCLESIHIWNAINVNDAGIEHLRRLTRLKSIQLSKARIGDRALRTLGAMPTLERIVVPTNRFTDRGLAQLTRLVHLKELWVGLRDDNGEECELRHILGIEDVYDRDAPPSEISREGVERLKASVPSLTWVSR